MGSVYFCENCLNVFDKTIIKPIINNDSVNDVCPIMGCCHELTEIDSLLSEIYPRLSEHVGIMTCNLGNIEGDEEIFSYIIFNEFDEEYIKLCQQIIENERFNSRIMFNDEIVNGNFTIAAKCLDQSIEEKLKTLSNFVLFLYELYNNIVFYEGNKNE